MKKLCSVLLCVTLLLAYLPAFADTAAVELINENNAEAEYVTEYSYNDYVNKLIYENGLTDLTDRMYDSGQAGDANIVSKAFDGNEGTFFEVSTPGLAIWRYVNDYFPAEGQVTDIIIKLGGNISDGSSYLRFGFLLSSDQAGSNETAYPLLRVGKVESTDGVIHISVPSEWPSTYDRYNVLSFFVQKLTESTWQTGETGSADLPIQFADFTVLGHNSSDVVKGKDIRTDSIYLPAGYANNATGCWGGSWWGATNDGLANGLADGNYWGNYGLYANQLPQFKIDLGSKYVITEISFKHPSAAAGAPFASDDATRAARLVGTEIWATNDETATWADRQTKAVCIGKIDNASGASEGWWSESADIGVEKPDGNAYRYILFGRDIAEQWECSGVILKANVPMQQYGDWTVTQEKRVVPESIDLAVGKDVYTDSVYLPAGYANNGTGCWGGSWWGATNDGLANGLADGSYWGNYGLYETQPPQFKIDLGSKYVITDVKFKHASSAAGWPFATDDAARATMLAGTEIWATNDETATWADRYTKAVCVGKIDNTSGASESWWSESEDIGSEKPDGNAYRYIFFGRDIAAHWQCSGIRVLGYAEITDSQNVEITSLSDTKGGNFTFSVPVVNHGFDNCPSWISGDVVSRSAKNYNVIIAAYDANGRILGYTSTPKQIAENTTTTISVDYTAPNGTARLSAMMVKTNGDLRLLNAPVNLTVAE